VIDVINEMEDTHLVGSRIHLARGNLSNEADPEKGRSVFLVKGMAANDPSQVASLVVDSQKQLSDNELAFVEEVSQCLTRARKTIEVETSIQNVKEMVK